MVGDRKGNRLEQIVFTRLSRPIRDYLKALRIVAEERALIADDGWQKKVVKEFLCFSGGLFSDKLNGYW